MRIDRAALRLRAGYPPRPISCRSPLNRNRRNQSALPKLRLRKKRPAPSRCFPLGAVFMNALVSLFEEAKLVPPLVPPFLMDTTGQRKAIKDLFSIFSALMSALLTSKSISGYWCGAVWGHHYP